MAEYQGWGTPTDIRGFQKKYGLRTDGIVGSKTASAMNTPRGMGMLPESPYEITTPAVAPAKGLVKSTPEGRMALRNDGFNSYMGDSAGGYSQQPIAATTSSNTTMPDLYTGSDFSKLSPEQQATFASGGGTIGDTGNMIPGSGGNNSWLDGMSNFETLQGAAGLGGLAMNAYGMFGSGGTMDVNKKNIELMNQQIANNREEMANRKGYRADIARTFGPKTGLGV